MTLSFLQVTVLSQLPALLMLLTTLLALRLLFVSARRSSTAASGQRPDSMRLRTRHLLYLTPSLAITVLTGFTRWQALRLRLAGLRYELEVRDPSTDYEEQGDESPLALS